MTPPILKLLGGGLGEIVGRIGAVIDDLHTSGEEKLAAHAKLLEIEHHWRGQLLEADVALAKEQAETLRAEIESGGLGKSWRPILMLTFTFIIAWNYIVGPLFGLRTLEIPPDMWDLLKLGIGGYIIGRSVEKIAPNVTEAIAAAKLKAG